MGSEFVSEVSSKLYKLYDKYISFIYYIFVCRGHWILTIINPHKDEICLFDPLHEGIVDDAWKDVVDMALKMFNAETIANKPKKRASIWKVIKVPKQPDLKQCGFFVLQYMRCIFEFEGSVDMDSMQSLVILIIVVLSNICLLICIMWLIS
ncbi:hypothetical protein ACS0TY_001756 [Phlomoides rotata]